MRLSLPVLPTRSRRPRVVVIFVLVARTMVEHRAWPREIRRQTAGGLIDPVACGTLAP